MRRNKEHRAEELERRSALNYATALHLINVGATEDYVRGLRDRADAWAAEAARLRETKRKKRDDVVSDVQPV